MKTKSSTGASRSEKFERILTPRIGAIWAGQGGHLIGIALGIDGQPDYCLIKPPAEIDVIEGIYGPNGRLASAECRHDGMANTLAMARAGSKIAEQALSIKHEGHQDYYIMAKNEAMIAAANCAHLYKKDRWYRTSTQFAGYDDYAWAQHFASGGQFISHKSHSLPALLVRRFAIR